MALYRKATRSSVGFPAGHLFGMAIANNGSDATNDIDVAAGQCRDSTDVKNLVGSAMTKRIDAAWAAGTGNGGRMSAAALTDTTYHFYAILKDSDGSVDYGFDVSATAPTMPTGYTYFRRIGSVRRVSGALAAFSQVGDEFLLLVPVRDVNTNNPGTSAILSVLSVPLGIKVLAKITSRINDATPATATIALITSPDQTDSTPSATVHTYVVADNATPLQISSGISVDVRTDTSAQVRYRINTSTTDHTFIIMTHGWYDDRGRSA